VDVVRRQLGENARAVHLPQAPVPEQQSLGTPVYRTAAFAFRTSDEYASVLNDERPGCTDRVAGRHARESQSRGVDDPSPAEFPGA